MLFKTLIVLVLALSVNCYGVDLDSMLEHVVEFQQQHQVPVVPVPVPVVPVVVKKPVRVKGGVASTPIVKPVIKPVVHHPEPVVVPVVHETTVVTPIVHPVVEPVVEPVVTPVVHHHVVEPVVVAPIIQRIHKPIGKTMSVVSRVEKPVVVETTAAAVPPVVEVETDEDVLFSQYMPAETMIDRMQTYRRLMEQYQLNIDEFGQVIERQVTTAADNVTNLGSKLRLILQFSYIEKYFHRQVAMLNKQLAIFFPDAVNKIKVVYLP